jgi:uncharacterized membrane-anchored protein YhcB (DUF1043 family)
VGDVLKLDTDVLDSLHRSMDQIRDVIGNAVNLAKHTENATGDGTLNARLHDFEHDWESNRNDMMETIAKFAGMVETVTESFEQLEQKLADALPQW